MRRAAAEQVGPGWHPHSDHETELSRHLDRAGSIAGREECVNEAKVPTLHGVVAIAGS
jgi:hypothetical protein